MKLVASSSEWQPSADFLQRIYLGYKAEQNYQKKQYPWGEELARQRYQIPLRAAPSLTQRALNAAINTLRRTSDPKPDLIKRMIQDQTIVYHFQQKQLRDKTLKQYQAIAREYTRKHMGLLVRGNLSVDQERVCENATTDFFIQIQKPDFVLSSSLPTYLIAILKRQIYSSNRPGIKSNPFSGDQPESQHFSVETLRYFQHTHRTITRYLGQMGATCQQIILRYYRIDVSRVSVVSDLPDAEQPLSEEEIRSRFAIGMGPPKSPETLKELSEKLGIDPRQASRQHLKCLDELVLNVAAELVTKLVPDSLKDTLQARIEEARKRRQL